MSIKNDNIEKIPEHASQKRDCCELEIVVRALNAMADQEWDRILGLEAIDIAKLKLNAEGSPGFFAGDGSRWEDI